MSHDTWLHRLVRRSVRPLVLAGITPNQVTAARLGTGLAACGALAAGPGPWVAVGCAAFVVSMLLDRADGELARATGTGSEFGHRFDLVSDGICDAGVLISIGIGLRGGTLGDLAPGLGLLAGVSVALIFWLALAFEASAGQGAARFEASGGFDPDDAMVVIPVAMLMGWGEQLLVASAVSAPLAAIIVGLILRARGRRASVPDEPRA